ncbi:hypothetical protein GCM10020220_108110 [Nonomuraea rubra]|uniref:hypothetical protein n=1 Tax=Nonomuraea rubra TaxID=46180 RepID=UPI0031E84677
MLAGWHDGTLAGPPARYAPTAPAASAAADMAATAASAAGDRLAGQHDPARNGGRTPGERGITGFGL